MRSREGSRQYEMTSQNFVVFSIANQRYALNLESVRRIVRAVEVTPLPDAPEPILGVIDVQGQVIPVVDTRRRLGLPCREIELSDQFIIVQDSDLTLAFVADEVLPVMEVPEAQVASSDRVLPGEGMVRGLARVDDGMIVVLSTERLLSREEKQGVSSALVEAVEAMQ